MSSLSAEKKVRNFLNLRLVALLFCIIVCYPYIIVVRMTCVRDLEGSNSHGCGGGAVHYNLFILQIVSLTKNVKHISRFVEIN